MGGGGRGGEGGRGRTPEKTWRVREAGVDSKVEAILEMVILLCVCVYVCVCVHIHVYVLLFYSWSLKLKARQHTKLCVSSIPPLPPILPLSLQLTPHHSHPSQRRGEGGVELGEKISDLLEAKRLKMKSDQ